MSQLDTKLRLLVTASLLVGGVALANDASHTSSKTSETTNSKATSSGTSSSGTMGSGAASSGTSGSMTSGAGKADVANNLDLTFKKGQTKLTAAQRNKIRTFIDGAKGRGEIEEVKIAVWSDKPFPTSGADLPETERSLASARAEQIENFLADQLDVSEVEVFNMAEKSNWLARTFNTDEAELKSVFSMEGGAPMSSEEFQVFKTKGQASKAVLLVRHAGDEETSPADSATIPPVHEGEDTSY